MKCSLSCLAMLLVAAGLAGCGGDSYEEEAKYNDPVCGELGYLPPKEGLSEAEARGRCSWYLYTAGGEQMFRTFNKLTNGRIDLLQIIDSRKRDRRFEDLGLVNDPGCTAPEGPDEYGLWLDDCKDPYSSGIMGFRKIPNPKFKKALWDLDAHNKLAIIEPPYTIGLTCAACHMGFNPANPPADPNQPTWDNMQPLVGNQYLDETVFYSLSLSEADTEWHILKSQHRGTSDPTRIANDLVNNPNAIRPVFNLGNRPMFKETLNDGSVADTFHLFIDGSDFAIETGGMRVYLNVGMCFPYWGTRHVPLLAFTPQKVFDMEKAAEVCDDWNEAWSRMPDIVAFLKSQDDAFDMSLANAPGGEQYLTDDEEVLRRGKLVFAEHCATCHSSKQPPEDAAGDPDKTVEWFKTAVMEDDFLDGNLLSNEARYSAIELGVNLARAMNNNSATGHLYDQFSSKTYKEQPSAGSAELYNPYDPDTPNSFTFPDAQGYYKPFPLINVWAFAPFFHNNALGEYTGDPSVEGRMKAFDDAARKLMWPEERDGTGGIFRTSVDSEFVIPTRGWLKVPAGTPTVLVANLDWNKLNLDKETILARLKHESFEEIVPLLFKHNIVPDFVQDKGHTYGAELPDEDKQALIEYMKWM